MKARTHLLSAVALFLLGQGLLFALEGRTRASGTYVTQQGIALLAPDSRYYLGLSASLEATLAAPWTRWGYPLLLLVGDRVGDATLFIVLLQSAAVILAGFALQRTVAARSGGPAGLLASAVLLANPLTAQWVRFVLTDLLFLCLIVAAVVLAERDMRRTDAIGATALLAVGLAAMSLRPNGALVLGAAIACLVAARSRDRRALPRVMMQLGVWSLTAGLLAVAAGASGPPAEGTIPSQLYSGVVIEGTEDVRLLIPMPPAPDADDPSLATAARYVMRHPLATGRLASTRMAVEIAQVRPHYSPLTNAAVAFIIIPYLLLIAIGMADRNTATSRAICVTFAAPLLLLIGATFAVPEGRYGWAPLIALAPVAGAGAARILGHRNPPVTSAGKRDGSSR